MVMEKIGSLNTYTLDDLKSFDTFTLDGLSVVKMLCFCECHVHAKFVYILKHMYTSTKRLFINNSSYLDSFSPLMLPFCTSGPYINPRTHGYILANLVGILILLSE